MDINRKKLAIGTVQFGVNYGIANNSGKINYNEAKSILEYAENVGVDTLDTAIIYGDSELTLGKIGVENWNVVSKIPPLPNNCVDVTNWLNECITSSLERLKLNQLYALLLHNANDLLGIHGDIIYKTLKGFQEKGVIVKIGVSIYDPEQLEKILKFYKLDIVQAPMNILDRRLANSGWLNKLNQMNIEIHIRSVFLQGLLLMDADSRPDYFNTWNLLWLESENIIKAKRISRLELCIRYILSFKEINKIVIGLDSLKHFKEIHSSFFKSPITLNEKLDCNDLNLINPTNWKTN